MQIVTVGVKVCKEKTEEGDEEGTLETVDVFSEDLLVSGIDDAISAHGGPDLVQFIAVVPTKFTYGGQLDGVTLVIGLK